MEPAYGPVDRRSRMRLGPYVGVGTNERSAKTSPSREEHARKGNGSMVAYFKYRAFQLEDDHSARPLPLPYVPTKMHLRLSFTDYKNIYTTTRRQRVCASRCQQD